MPQYMKRSATGTILGVLGKSGELQVPSALELF